jgi:DNA polymerase IV
MILHIDMDAFFASVEQRDAPELKGKCVVVGGDSDRGVVSAASYEARQYGVHSAMPIFKVRRLCPEAVFIRPRMSRYKSVSREIMTLLQEFSPCVEVVSIDEAYLDADGSERLQGDALHIAFAIKERIFEKVELNCSIGIAPLRFLAKIASDIKKPNGLFAIMPEEVPAFIESLPIEKVPGVGRKTKHQLSALSIETLGDVKKHSAQLILDRFGKFGSRLLSLANGVDNTPVTPHRPTKSISSEQTLRTDTDDKTVLQKILLAQSEIVGRQLRKKGFRARTVSLKIKDAEFKQITRRLTLPVPTQSSETIYNSALKLLADYDIVKQVRLIGVGAENLVSGDTPVQLELFSGPPKRDSNWEKVDKAVDAITQKYGPGSVQKAGLVPDR